MDIATGEDVDGPIDRCRYSDVAWLPGGKAFYYGRRLPPDAVPAGEEQFHRRVYLHRVGTAGRARTSLILGDGLEKTNYYGVSGQPGRPLAGHHGLGRHRAAQRRVDRRPVRQRREARRTCRSCSRASTPAPGRVAGPGRAALPAHRPGRAARPDRRADPADPAFPEYASWQDLVGEDPEAVLTDFAILDGPGLPEPVLLAARARHAISEVSVHDLAIGDLVRRARRCPALAPSAA